MRPAFHRRIERLGLANVTIVQADACDPREVVAASVDVVYSVGLLETIPDYNRLTEASRVLTP